MDSLPSFSDLRPLERAAAGTFVLAKVQGFVTAALILSHNRWAGPSLVSAAGLIVVTLTLCGVQWARAKAPRKACTCGGHR